MVYRKGEMTKAQIDREWPHQVALAADLVRGCNFMVIHDFCRSEKLSLCRRGHSLQRDGEWYVWYCFAEREHAERFQRRFGGEFIDPASRPKWAGMRATGANTSAIERHLHGRCVNCDD